MNPTYDFHGQVAAGHRRRRRHGAGHRPGLRRSRRRRRTRRPRTSTPLSAATDELTAAGHQALGVTCDVSDEAQVAALVDRTVDTFGRLDMAFNNAGIMIPPSDAADEPAESFDRVTAINLRGVWACMKHELRQMRAQGSGAIVNCSSLGGLVGQPRPRRLPRHQARRHRPHQERRAGIRAARHPHQRRLPRHDRDADGRRHDRQGRARRRRRRGRTSRSAASDAATRSPPPSSGCAAPARASCSASHCPWTAATPRADSSGDRVQSQESSMIWPTSSSGCSRTP